MITNAFYAATNRNTLTNIEPTLLVTTKDLGETVQVRIRDNGNGIPAEIREKIYDPFFTTKPSGEGTGLGLSISYDIIVKQHGGTINLETEPNEFTEFIIEIPRRQSD